MTAFRRQRRRDEVESHPNSHPRIAPAAEIKKLGLQEHCRRITSGRPAVASGISQQSRLFRGYMGFILRLYQKVPFAILSMGPPPLPAKQIPLRLADAVTNRAFSHYRETRDDVAAHVHRSDRS